MNHGWTFREQIPPTAHGTTVLDYYTDRYRHSTRDTWRDRIHSGQILLNNTPTTPTTCLQKGQWLTYHRPPWQEPPVPLHFEVFHEDPHLLVINKPAGLPVLPGGGFLEHTLLWQVQQRYGDTFPIHRLGRGTSGLLLLARSPSARASLSQQMRDRQIHKVYWAIASGHPPSHPFTIQQPIGKIPHPVLGYLHAATPDGSPAHSECRVLHQSDQTALVEVTILTGRPHQIRIHLAAAGYPLWGDSLYGVGGVPAVEVALSDAEAPAAGEVAVPGDCGYFLHAYCLEFKHPVTEEQMSFVCPVPDEGEWVSA